MELREWIWLGALAVAAIGLWHRMGQISPQRVVRYEAIRRKRALAKALRAEIKAILRRPEGLSIDCSVYDSAIDDVGRLMRHEADLIVQFYQLAKQSDKIDPDTLGEVGEKALNAMDAMLQRTQSKRDQLDDEFQA